VEKEQILDFTRRISQSNRSGLTVINYEIIFAYLDDAKKAYQEEKEFRKNENQIKRKAYKREKNREYREAYRNRVTADTMKREHDIAVMLLSHEKYH